MKPFTYKIYQKLKSCIDLEFYYQKRLPLFLSFPRCGSHWINFVMELYFDRPRLRRSKITAVDKDRKDWMWFHDHDVYCKKRFKDVLYLWRDPVDVVFSNIEFERNCLNEGFRSFRIDDGEKEIVKIFSQRYARHLQFYIFGGRCKEVVRYENFKEFPSEEFAKICRFFGIDFNEKRCNRAFAMAHQEKLVRLAESSTASPFGDSNLANEYKQRRNFFREKYGNEIAVYFERIDVPWEGN